MYEIEQLTHETKANSKIEATSILFDTRIPVVYRTGIYKMNSPTTTSEVSNKVFFREKFIKFDPMLELNNTSIHLASQPVKSQYETLVCPRDYSQGQFQTIPSSPLIDHPTRMESEENMEEGHWGQPQNKMFKYKNAANPQISYFGIGEAEENEYNSGHSYRNSSTDFSPLLLRREPIFINVTGIETEIDEEDDSLIDPLHKRIDVKELFEHDINSVFGDRKQNLKYDVRYPLNYFPYIATQAKADIDQSRSQFHSKLETPPELNDIAEHTHSPKNSLSEDSILPEWVETNGKKHFICKHCFASFPFKSWFITHLRKHTGEKPFQCRYCSACFAHKISLEQHKRKHALGKSFTCKHCNMSFDYEYRLEKHMRMHTGAEQFGCSYCSAKFNYKSNLAVHMRTHNGERFRCSHCSASYTRRSTLKQHIMRDHTGERPFRCSICPASYIRRTALKEHMWTHIGEKPFGCSHCSASFTRKCHLKSHMLMHSGERPFTCGYCLVSFASRGNLTSHMRKHLDEKLFFCTHCSASFIWKANLQQHMRVHMGEKPHGCNQCSASFDSEGELKNHLSRNVCRRPFTCSYCPDSFSQKSSLKEHIQREHLRLVCSICPNTFVSKVTLRRHMRRQHSVELDPLTVLRRVKA